MPTSSGVGLHHISARASSRHCPKNVGLSREAERIIPMVIGRKRESLSIELSARNAPDSDREQKLDYIHYNPLVARLVTCPEDDHFSLAGFYERRG